MQKYKYKAAKLDGKYVKGTLDAANETELRNKLEKEKLFLVEAKVEEPKQSKALKDKLLVEFCRDLGMLLGTGVPLIKALNVMIKRDINPKVKEVYTNIFRHLKEGNMLSEAMALQNGFFPPLLINMIKASEISGNMDETLLSMAKYYEKNYKLKQKVRGAMIYPIILMIVTVIVVIAVFIFILPKFFAMFEELNTPLPLITQFMIALSKGITNYWYIAIALGVLLVTAIKSALVVPKVRLKWDRLKLRLPVAGKLLMIIYTARFSRTLSSCYSSGISMINSLYNAQRTIGNSYIESQFEEVIKLIKQGENLSTAIDFVDGLDKRLVANIIIGEETGKLDTMLESIASVFDFDAEVALGKLSVMVEPMMIILMAIIVGTIMVSVLLPLPAMYNSIGGLGGM